MTSEQLSELASTTPSLLNEQLLERYNPHQQKILGCVSQNPKIPTEIDQLARQSFPQEQNLIRAKRKLASVLSVMKGKLTDDKLEIVNASVEAGHKGQGTRAKYYLREITMVLADQTVVPPYTPDLFDPSSVKDWEFKEDLILAGLGESNRELFEKEYGKLYALWVNGKLPPGTDLNRLIELAAMATSIIKK